MNFNTAPAYTLKGSGKKPLIQLSGEKYDSPGPIYNVAQLGIKTQSLSYTVGNSTRTLINHRVQKTPPPTAYNSKIFNKSPSKTIPKAQYQEKYSINPEGGVYNPNANFVKDKVNTYTIGLRYLGFTEINNTIPGPTDYFKDKMNETDSRKSKFGLQRRFSEQKLKDPGPGDYNLTNQKVFHKPQGKFSHANRFNNQTKMTPSPNQYFKQSIENKNNLGKTLSGRFKGFFQPEVLTSNSFGKYQINMIDKGISNKLGKMGKDSRSKQPKRVKPGPGQYNIANYKVFNSPRAFIHTAQYNEKPTYLDAPGAGTYQLPNQKNIEYSIPRSKSANVINNNPGVGRYTTTKGLQTKKGFLIGKSQRTNFVSKNIAGIGDYQIINKKNGGITIPKANRNKRIQKAPGVGDYNIQSTISNLNYYSKYVS